MLQLPLSRFNDDQKKSAITQPAITARYVHLFDDPLRTATERVGSIVDGNAPSAEVISIASGR